MRKFPIRHVATCTLLVTAVITCFVLFTDRPDALSIANGSTDLDEKTRNDLGQIEQSPVHADRSSLPQELVDELSELPTNGSSASRSESTDLAQVEIRNGDSLSAIFDRLRISHADLMLVQEASPDHWKTQRLLAGRHLKYQLSANGDLEYMEYSPEDLTVYAFTRLDDELSCEIRTRKIVSKETYHYVSIERGDSVISAGLAAGVRQEKTVWKIPKLLQWDLDFYHDIHPGDSYQILYYEQFVDGEYYGDGEIIALQFESGKQTYELVRYEENGMFNGYFTPKGYAARKRFLRSPVEYKKISSHFSPSRLHPVYKVHKPHRGIDYAAPLGTPVYATADGTVSKYGKNRLNGNYVFLEHDRVYTTKYLHLHRIDPAVKQGAEIKQGQRIGSVGSTGVSTGPHLHYEFIVNGVHQNPATVHLPEGEPLSESDVARFQAHANELIARMNALKSQYRANSTSLVKN